MLVLNTNWLSALAASPAEPSPCAVSDPKASFPLTHNELHANEGSMLAGSPAQSVKYPPPVCSITVIQERANMSRVPKQVMNRSTDAYGVVGSCGTEVTLFFDVGFVTPVRWGGGGPEVGTSN